MSYAYDNEEFSRYYDTFVAEHVSNDVYWVDATKDIYAEIIRRTFIDDQCTTIVELGCGTADNLLYFKNLFNNKQLKLIGIDHSQAMLDRAKEKLAARSVNDVQFLRASLTNFADYVEDTKIDCILLPAGTFHHLITDNERQELLTNIQRTLRYRTGLFVLYLFSDSLIYIEQTPTSGEEDKFKLIAVENKQHAENEWICTQTFELNVPPKIELSWQLRTCSIPKLMDLFIANEFEPVYYCSNGKELLPYNENNLFSSMNNSTPVIIVFRTIKSTN